MNLSHFPEVTLKKYLSISALQCPVLGGRLHGDGGDVDNAAPDDPENDVAIMQTKSVYIVVLLYCYCMFLGVIPCENYSSTLYICSTISVIPISGRYVIFGCSLLLRDKSEKLIGTTFSSGLFGVLKTLSGINQMIYINYQKLWTVRFPAFTFQTKKLIFRTILD